MLSFESWIKRNTLMTNAISGGKYEYRFLSIQLGFYQIPAVQPQAASLGAQEDETIYGFGRQSRGKGHGTPH
jgi:hypothetical protein